jgi:hypothetical protein
LALKNFAGSAVDNVDAHRLRTSGAGGGASASASSLRFCLSAAAEPKDRHVAERSGSSGEYVNSRVSSPLSVNAATRLRPERAPLNQITPFWSPGAMSRPRKILVEGIDRLGKDTLLKGIQDRHGFHLVLRYGKPLKLDFYAGSNPSIACSRTILAARAARAERLA